MILQLLYDLEKVVVYYYTWIEVDLQKAMFEQVGSIRIGNINCMYTYKNESEY